MQDLLAGPFQQVVHCKRGKLNIASCRLFIGAMGQESLYGELFPHRPDGIVMVPLSLPWLTVFFISFCRMPPFAARPFRDCLIFAMSGLPV